MPNIRLTLLTLALTGTALAQQPVLTGKSAFTDCTRQTPGVRRHITVADLPKPMPDTSVDNGPDILPRPKGAWPIAPAGFKVDLYAGPGTSSSQGPFAQPRILRLAPNGDLFLADSKAGKIWVMRGTGVNGVYKQLETFATGLDHPFGIAFWPLGPNPQYIYIANTTSVVRFPYKNGQMLASGAASTPEPKPEVVVPELPGYAQLRGGGHWTRDLAFSQDGKRLFVSVGSGSNADDPDTHPREFHRADVLEYTPEGKFVKIYASGLRNCVGEAINPTTGQLWCSTNERDGLGDNLVPDYITSVREDGFYGWPWFYMGGLGGGVQDPRLVGTHPELQARVITPDILLQPHFASLEMVFYPTHLSLPPSGQLPSAFPQSYRGDAFAAEHGSWNKSHRAGYEVIRLPMKGGHATGEFEDFLTGFCTKDGVVWGRPVGVAVAQDGSLFVSDDGSNSIWHVTYTGTTNTQRAAGNRPAR